MDRKLLIVSTVMVLAGLLLMAYSDPGVRAGFGGTTGTTRVITAVSFTRTAFTFTGTAFTFTGTGFPGGNRTFPFNGTVGFPTRVAGGGGISTTTQVESFVGLGLVAVGLLLEVFTLFLWQTPADQRGQAQLPAQDT